MSLDENREDSDSDNSHETSNTNVKLVQGRDQCKKYTYSRFLIKTQKLDGDPLESETQ